jgi:hypothetical protein
MNPVRTLDTRTNDEFLFIRHYAECTPPMSTSAVAFLRKWPFPRSRSTRLPS